MPDVCVALISVIVGAILGGFISWMSSIKIIKAQETCRAKRELRNSISKLIVKIRYNDFVGKWKLWRNLRDYSSILEEAIASAIPYLDKRTGKAVLKAYQYYKHTDVFDSLDSLNEPFEIYDIDESIANVIPNFTHKNGEEFAIHNLEKILEIIP